MQAVTSSRAWSSSSRCIASTLSLSITMAGLASTSLAAMEPRADSTWAAASSTGSITW